MKVIPKTINSFVVIPGEKSVILNINESLEVEYLLTENSDNNVLQDLVEAKAFATALLYLNETYKLVINNKLFKENKVEDYYNDCNSLLKENVVIVEEKGIPLVSIKGYNIYESNKGILRGNGKKKLKESFDSIPIDEFTTGKWKVTLTDDGGNKLIVSFIDMSQDKERFPEGQFVCSYYLDTLLGKNDYGPSIDQMTEFHLWNDIPAWTVEGEDLVKIAEWLKSFSKDKSSLDESDTQIDIDKLAWDLVDFMDDFDPYDFGDNYNSKEEAYEETLKSLNSKSEINGIIAHLKEVIEDASEEEHKEIKSLIARLEQVIPTLNEDGEGTQVGDIAPKVDQDMNGKPKKKKEDKKYYDILLSGIDESMDMVLNKGFMKNVNGQYERDGYILVKENDKFIAVRKDKLKIKNKIEEYN